MMAFFHAEGMCSEHQVIISRAWNRCIRTFPPALSISVVTLSTPGALLFFFKDFMAYFTSSMVGSPSGNGFSDGVMSGVLLVALVVSHDDLSS